MFTNKDIVRLSSALSEPGWMSDRRASAYERFEKLELPREKEEPWRYTNLAQLKFSFEGFKPSTKPGDISELNKGHEHLFSLVDGEGHIFDAARAALLDRGRVIEIARGQDLSEPIEITWTIDDEGEIISPHTLLVVGDDAEVTLIERFGSHKPGMVLAGLETIVGKGGRVRVFTYQDHAADTWHFGRHKTTLAAGATFHNVVVTTGAKFARQETELVLQGEGASARLLGLYSARGGQTFDFRTLQDHTAPHCTSDLLYKGALNENGHTVYSGLIHVRPQGAQTDAYQTNRNLVLSDHARADSKPELEIENNDVRCSHGASVGQMDEEQLFYLVSRGIERQEAQRLIVDGFFEEVIGSIEPKSIQEQVRAHMSRSLSN